MKEKKHELKTISDIVKVVNEKNVDNFLIDFGDWLNATLQVNSLNDTLSKVSKLKIIQDIDKMIWIDDGKNDGKIIIDIKKK